jgi:hypothetical protein
MATKKQTAGVQVLLLRDCIFGSAGTVVTVSDHEAQCGAEQGMLDDHPQALAAALKAPTSSDQSSNA